MPNPMILSCESTVDVPFSYMQERNIPVLFYNYRIDGVECKCWICHSDCLGTAKMTRDAIREYFPNIDGEIRICDIGTIIAGRCGFGTVAAFFFGDERTPDRSGM